MHCKQSPPSLKRQKEKRKAGEDASGIVVGVQSPQNCNHLHVGRNFENKPYDLK